MRWPSIGLRQKGGETDIPPSRPDGRSHCTPRMDFGCRS